MESKEEEGKMHVQEEGLEEICMRVYKEINEIKNKYVSYFGNWLMFLVSELGVGIRKEIGLLARRNLFGL